MTNAVLKMPLPSSVSFQKPKIDCTSRQPKLDRTGQKHQNNVTPRSRERGVILTLAGWNKLQTAKSQVEFQENAGDRFTLEKLGERTELSVGTLSKVLGRLEPVDRYSLQTVFQSFGLALDKSDYARPNLLFKELNGQQQPQRDWGEAVDVSLFCGRETELATLQQWVLEKHCRLVTVLGIGGIGKSALAVKLALQVEQAFEIVVWRSLQNAPTLEELLESLLPSLLPTQKESSLPASLDQKIDKLMDCLRSSRCLLILDNMETILASGEQSGRYRAGYESYGQLLQSIGTIHHQSCVVLTSREKPQQIALLEGEKLPVCSFRLGALQPAEGRELFQHKGQFIGSETEWKALIAHYGGHPLALKLVAVATQELFDGSITAVLKYIDQGLLIFDGIRDVFDRQFDRLSPVEQEVMLWLAIHSEPVSLEELRENLVSAASKRELLGVLSSLLRRSLIEQNMTQFSLQPLVMKYVLKRLIRQVCYELEQQQIDLLRTHALFKAKASDRAVPKNLILQWVAEWLLTEANKPHETEQWLKELLEQQRQASRQSGYTISNLLSLLRDYRQQRWGLQA